MKKYNAINLFKTAERLRTDFVRLLNERGRVDSVVHSAYALYEKAIKNIRSIGGIELEREFERWYMDIRQ